MIIVFILKKPKRKPAGTESSRRWSRRQDPLAMLETPDLASFLWPPDAKSQLTRKDPDAGKD